jgi:hypothetical protein
VICTSTQILLPIFSLGYPETAEILISHTLPSPRTLIALLAKGLGEIMGLKPEQEIHGAPVRLVFQWVLESSSYAFSHPLSPIKKSFQMWRVFWLEKEYLLKKEKQGKGQREIEGLRDAVEVEVVSLNKISAYIFIDLNKVNILLRKYLPNSNLTEKDIESAFMTVQLIGKSEMLATPITVKTFNKFNIIGSLGKINVYCPYEWIKKPPKEGLEEEMLVHINLLPNHIKSAIDEPKKMLKVKLSGREEIESRRVKARFILPLSLMREISYHGKIIEYFKQKDIDVELKDDFTIVETIDGGKVPLPKTFLEGC